MINIQKSESIKELAIALSKAQSEIKPASKDVSNKFFGSKYADLSSVWESCREPLTKNGLSVTQHPTTEGNIVRVETILMHITGEFMSSVLAMTAKTAQPTAQEIGSLITYARRYSLSAIIGIASEEDDDGNAASGATPAKKPTDKPQPQQQQQSTQQVPSQEVQNAQTKQLMDVLEKVAIEKFGDLDKFLLWRIDNSQPENLSQLKDIEIAKLLRLVREYKGATK